MTEEDAPGAVEGTITHFPPIPLVSGDIARSRDGELHSLESVTVRMVGTDGTVIEVALEYRFGGWWPPAPISRA